MKTLLTSVAAFGLVIGLSAAALAAQTTGQPGNGNQGCFRDAFKNPGKGIQFLHEASGMGPGQLVKGTGTTVGGFIDAFCGGGAPPPPPSPP